MKTTTAIILAAASASAQSTLTSKPTSTPIGKTLFATTFTTIISGKPIHVESQNVDLGLVTGPSNPIPTSMPAMPPVKKWETTFMTTISGHTVQMERVDTTISLKPGEPMPTDWTIVPGPSMTGTAEETEKEKATGL